MYRGHIKDEWSRPAAQMALLANINSSGKGKPFQPEHFIPMGIGGKEYGGGGETLTVDTLENLAAALEADRAAMATEDVEDEGWEIVTHSSEGGDEAAEIQESIGEGRIQGSDADGGYPA